MTGRALQELMADLMGEESTDAGRLGEAQDTPSQYTLLWRLKQLDANVATPGQFVKTVAAAGTPEALAADGTYFKTATVIAKKAARTDNVGSVYLGIGATNDTQPYELQPGEIVVIRAPAGEKYDLNDWYLDVAQAGDGVIVIY